MADVLYFVNSAVTLTADGVEGGMLQFYADSNIVEPSTISASSSESWLTVGSPITQSSLRYIPYSATTNPNNQRTATVSLGGVAMYPGESPRLVGDYATVVQNSYTGGTGSISVSTGSVDVVAAGSGGTIGFTTQGINTSTIGVSPDNTWLLVESHSTTGFTWSATKNNTNSTRYARVTITGLKQGGQDYAYAYVGFTQPAMSDVGYISFSTNTEKPAAEATTGSTTYTYSNISSISSVVPSESWLHATGSTLGTLNWSVDANPYANRRNGYITVNAESQVDGSLVQASLYFEQQAMSGGTVQVGFIYISPDSITLPTSQASGGSFSVTCQNIDPSTLRIASSGGNWSTCTLSANNTLISWSVNDATNTEGYTTSTVSITGTDISGNTVTPVTVSVNQPPIVEFIEFPIWKDTDIYIKNNSDYIDYIIQLNGDAVYSGRAYTLGDKVKIRLNTIMEQVLVPDLDIDRNGLQDNNSYANAVLAIALDGEHYRPYKEIKCYADWSYKDQYANILSNPIKREIDRRQKLVCTAMDYAGDGDTMVVAKRIGSSTQTSTYSLENGIGTIVQYAGGYNSFTVSAGNSQVTYLVVDSCKRYCLYYLNARGGWDSYLFEKGSNEKDNFVRSTFKRIITNTKPQHGTVEYKNAITKTWTLKTGYLTDGQSLNLAENLMSSPCAYLHDLDEGEIYPVIITTKSTDYKTFYRNGRRFSSYDIDVQLAQDRRRR